MQSSGNLWRKRNLDLEIGIIGLGRDGKIVLRHLLQKTVEDLAVYDPDGRTTRHPVRNYDTANYATIVKPSFLRSRPLPI